MQTQQTDVKAILRLGRLGLLAAIGLAGCGKAPVESPSEEPRFESDKIIFPAHAPQLASLGVQTAQPRKLAVEHMTGRLYWSDDATVRIFTPVHRRRLADRRHVGRHAGEPDIAQVAGRVGDQQIVLVRPHPGFVLRRFEILEAAVGRHLNARHGVILQPDRLR